MLLFHACNTTRSWCIQSYSEKNMFSLNAEIAFCANARCFSILEKSTFFFADRWNMSVFLMNSDMRVWSGVYGSGYL